MRSLNRSFRGKDYATDVLSFPFDTPLAGRATPRHLGDIVIAAGVARAAGGRRRPHARHRASGAGAARAAAPARLRSRGRRRADGAGRSAAPPARRVEGRADSPSEAIENGRSRDPPARGADMTPLLLFLLGAGRGLRQHRHDRVQRADAAVAAPLGRTRRPRRRARPLPRRAAAALHSGAAAPRRHHRRRRQPAGARDRRGRRARAAAAHRRDGRRSCWSASTSCRWPSCAAIRSACSTLLLPSFEVVARVLKPLTSARSGGSACRGANGSRRPTPPSPRRRPRACRPRH